MVFIVTLLVSITLGRIGWENQVDPHRIRYPRNQIHEHSVFAAADIQDGTTIGKYQEAQQISFTSLLVTKDAIVDVPRDASGGSHPAKPARGPSTTSQGMSLAHGIPR